MPALFFGLAIAVMLFFMFNRTDDSSLRKTIKKWFGLAVLGVIAWGLLGLVLVRFLPVVLCGVFIFLALRWLFSTNNQTDKAADPSPSAKPRRGSRMQRIQRRQLN